MLICDSGKCSACNACINICPKSCIGYEITASEMKYAVIKDTKQCIQCDLCKKVCPQNNENAAEELGNNSYICYAAWSLDKSIRSKSASGGIATELYHMAADFGYHYAGTSFDDERDVKYTLNRNNDYQNFQNSKYVYSDTAGVYKEIVCKLKEKETVVFVGLPCQVAGLKQYIKVLRISEENLYTVDLVCHGVTPDKYLKEHIKNIETKKKSKATQIFFRDPEFFTQTYTFSLRNQKGVFYKRKVHRNDTYQIGYHYGIAYRENCYSCIFSVEKRIGDLTLADFSGLGSKKPCEYNSNKVSCVLVNTRKGEEWIKQLADKQYIYLEERPIEEELVAEKRLHSPTQVPKERKMFLKVYAENKDFDKAMKCAARKIIWRNEFRFILRVNEIKKCMKKVIPSPIKDFIKKRICK